MNTFTEAPEGSVVETEKMMPKLLFFWRPIHRDYGFYLHWASPVYLYCVSLCLMEVRRPSLHFTFSGRCPLTKKKEDKHMNCCVNHVFG